MLRFYYVIITALIFNWYFIPLMKQHIKHPEKYTEQDCYRVAQRLIRMIIKRGRITTITAGAENLPKHGGYIMYSNHQGKYDALGIIASHKKPCTVVMDQGRATDSFINHLFIQLIRGKSLDKQNPRQQVCIINEIIAEISEGRRYLLFPEGGYTDNKNNLQEFHSGSFKIPLKSKCTIIPIAIYNSYVPFHENSLRKVTTQVYYLEPIFYEQYAGMKSSELCDLVALKIRMKITELENTLINSEEPLPITQ